jgi:CubicO group peptidase (beta-lactamase class C family)
MKLTFLAALPFAVALEAQTPKPNPAAIERLLRPAIAIAGTRDTAFDIVERMRYWHVPGVSLAIIDDFKIVYARGFGVAEFGGSTPVDTTTLFLAGSISKPVFATGALRVVEGGKLSLDEDVNARLKSWRLPDSRFTEREKVTLRRLLTHSAGLTVWGFPGYAATAAVPTVPQLLDGTPPANTPAVRNDTTPGAFWRYSGGGFTIAQLLASDVTGEPFPALMKRVVLLPSGMTRSTYENPLPVARHREAASGHERIDTPVPGRFHTYPEMAAAGLWTTAPELARWALALTRSYNGEPNGVLSPGMARQMISNQQPITQQYGGGHFGLGVAVAGEGDSITFSHNGRDEGFVAAMAMMPKLGRGYVILTNGVSGPFISEVRRAFAELYGMSGPRTERKLVDTDTASLQAYVGKYEVRQGNDMNVLEVSVERGSLMLYNTIGKRRIRLWPGARDLFFDANSGQTFVFERESGEGSAVKSMRLGIPDSAPRAVRK